MELYATESLELTGYPPDYNILTGGWEGDTISISIANRVMQSAALEAQRIWLIEYFPRLWDPDQLLEKWLDLNHELIDEVMFGQIWIRLYQISGDDDLD